MIPTDVRSGKGSGLWDVQVAATPQLAARWEDTGGRIKYFFWPWGGAEGTTPASAQCHSPSGATGHICVQTACRLSEQARDQFHPIVLHEPTGQSPVTQRRGDVFSIQMTGEIMKRRPMVGGAHKMICPQCAATNSAGAAYCHRCGTPLSAICIHCGSSLPAGARFCGACGRSVLHVGAPTRRSVSFWVIGGVATFALLAGSFAWWALRSARVPESAEVTATPEPVEPSPAGLHVPTGPPVAPATAIGLVDTGRVLAESAAALAYQKKLEEREKNMAMELQLRRTTPSKKEVAGLEEQYRKELQAEKARLETELNALMRRTAGAVVAERGLAGVLVKGSVHYWNPVQVVDTTDEVIARLR